MISHLQKQPELTKRNRTESIRLLSAADDRSPSLKKRSAKTGFCRHLNQGASSHLSPDLTSKNSLTLADANAAVIEHNLDLQRCQALSFETNRNKKKKFQDKFHLIEDSSRRSPWTFSSHMTTNIASWHKPFTAPYDVKELKQLGWRFLGAPEVNSTHTLGDIATIFRLDDTTRQKIDRNGVQGIMKDKSDFMTESREHCGGKMFCAGFNASDQAYKGSTEVSDMCTQISTQVMENFVSSHETLRHILPCEQHVHKSRGGHLLNSERFTKLCGSLTMMNVEHIDNSDTSPSLIVWRKFRSWPELDAYFLLEIPAEDGKPAEFVALHITDGTGIVLDTRRVKHRTILIGPLMQSLMRPCRDLTSQSDTHICTQFSKLDVDHMARLYWEEEGRGIIGLAWIQSLNKSV